MTDMSPLEYFEKARHWDLDYLSYDQNFLTLIFIMDIADPDSVDERQIGNNYQHPLNTEGIDLRNVTITFQEPLYFTHHCHDDALPAEKHSEKHSHSI